MRSSVGRPAGAYHLLCPSRFKHVNRWALRCGVSQTVRYEWTFDASCVQAERYFGFDGSAARSGDGEMLFGIRTLYSCWRALYTHDPCCICALSTRGGMVRCSNCCPCCSGQKPGQGQGARQCAAGVSAGALDALSAFLHGCGHILPFSRVFEPWDCNNTFVASCSAPALLPFRQFWQRVLMCISAHVDAVSTSRAALHVPSRPPTDRQARGRWRSRCSSIA